MRLLDTGYKGPVHTLCFQHDGLRLLGAQGRFGHVLIWRLDTFTAEPGFDFSHRVGGIVSSATGLLAVVDAAGHFHIGATGATLFAELPHVIRREWFQPFPSLAFSPCGRWLFCTHGQQEAGMRGYRASLFDTTTCVRHVFPGSDERGFRLGHGAASQAAFSPDGSRLALCFRAREALVVAFPSGERVLTLPHGTKAHMAAYSPDGATLATASPDGIIRVWDAASGRERTRFKGQAKPLHAVAYSPDGRTVAAACGTGTVTMWDVASGRARVALDWGIGAVHSVAFAPDGMRAAAGGLGVVAIWDIDWDD